MEYGSFFDKAPLQQLLQFADECRVKSIEGFRMRPLENELEFYELVDMDTEG